MFSRFIEHALSYTLTDQPQQEQDQPKQIPASSTSRKDLLPVELVGRILELEMCCEQASACPELVSQLVSLYADAYEYYERHNSAKCCIYQKRMRIFLSKHSIDSLMKGQKGDLIAKRQLVQRKKQHAVYGTREEAKRLIDRSEKKAQKSRSIIKEEIHTQQHDLEARIKRRQSRSNRSTKTDNEDTCDDLFGGKVVKGGQLGRGGLGFDNLVVLGLKERTGKRVFI